jgi:hypothetical protein
MCNFSHINIRVKTRVLKALSGKIPGTTIKIQITDQMNAFNFELCYSYLG